MIVIDGKVIENLYTTNVGIKDVYVEGSNIYHRPGGFLYLDLQLGQPENEERKGAE